MSYLDYANPNDSYLSGNDSANNGYNQPDDSGASDNIRVGVFGTDNKKLSWDENYRRYLGLPDDSTKQIFDSMILTPIGMRSVKGYINHKFFEFKFKVVNDYVFDESGTVANGHTDFNSEPVSVLISTMKLGLMPNGLYNRFDSANIKERLNVIGVHEKGHVGRTSSIDDEQIPVQSELQSRFEYFMLYDDVSQLGSWLPNYVDYFKTWYDQLDDRKKEILSILDDAANDVLKYSMSGIVETGKKKNMIKAELDKFQ